MGNPVPAPQSGSLATITRKWLYRVHSPASSSSRLARITCLLLIYATQFINKQGALKLLFISKYQINGAPNPLSGNNGVLVSHRGGGGFIERYQIRHGDACSDISDISDIFGGFWTFSPARVQHDAKTTARLSAPSDSCAFLRWWTEAKVRDYELGNSSSNCCS